jgi:hypothetical protein
VGATEPAAKRWIRALVGRARIDLGHAIDLPTQQQAWRVAGCVGDECAPAEG